MEVLEPGRWHRSRSAGVIGVLKGKRVAFVGAGSMTQALLDGLVGGGRVPAEAVTVTNRADDARLRRVRDRWGVRVTRDPAALVTGADALVLACKPADVAEAVAGLGRHVRPGQLVISVAAGVTTAAIERLLPPDIAVVRAMPNTSSRIRESATALAAGRRADAGALALAEAVFTSVGQVVVVPEDRMDAVTAVSGSGPAYVYYMVEKMIEAAEAAGLPRAVARQLVVQTVYGAARMVVETGTDPAELRRQVTSPNGTTAAALAVLEERGFGPALVAAVARAAERSRELAALVEKAAAVQADDEEGSAAGARGTLPA